MPTYAYLCESCQHQLEEFQGMDEPKLTTCPECGLESLRRLIGGGGALIFRGEGWFCKEYPSDKRET